MSYSHFYETDNESVQSDFDILNKALNINKGDKLCYKMIILNKNKTGKSKKINVFSSGSQGSIIRNAVTGERYPEHKVGSIHEDNYYKVKISTNNFSNESGVFFYSSVDQFERHMECVVDQKTKYRLFKKEQQLQK